MCFNNRVLILLTIALLTPAPLFAGKIADRARLFTVEETGDGAFTLNFTTPQVFRFWILRDGKVYRVGYRDGQLVVLNALKSSRYILENHADHVVDANDADQVTLTLRTSDGRTQVLNLDTGAMRFTSGGGSSSSSSGSSSSSSSSTSSSSGGSSSGGDADEEEQDDDPVDVGDHDGSDPICQLTGTCGGSSSGSSSGMASSSGSSSSTSSSGGSSSGSSGGWTPSGACTTSVPANAIRPALRNGKIEGTFPNGSVIDLRGMTLNVSVAARSGVVIRGGSDIRVTGGRIIGPAPKSTIWSHMKKDPVAGNGYDGDGVLFKGANGVAKVDHMVIDNMMDPLSFNGQEVDAFEVCGVYSRGARDDFIEDDSCHDGIVRDSLVDGAHMFISARPGHQSNGKVCAPKLTIENSLVSINCQPYNGDMKGNKDRESCNGTTTGAGQIFKTSVGGPTVTAKNTIFMVEDKNEGGTPQMNFPKGSYQNVTLVWLGGGQYPGQLQPGITVTTNKAVWDNARAAWLRAHNCDVAGNNCNF